MPIKHINKYLGSTFDFSSVLTLPPPFCLAWVSDDSVGSSCFVLLFEAVLLLLVFAISLCSAECFYVWALCVPENGLTGRVVNTAGQPNPLHHPLASCGGTALPASSPQSQAALLSGAVLDFVSVFATST